MGIKDKIINDIINKYDSLNENNKNQNIFLKSANENEEPFFVEYRKELINGVRTINEEIIENIVSNQDIETPEELNLLYDTDEEIDKEILDLLESKILNILKHLNIDFYKNNKSDLKTILIDDLINKYIQIDISETLRDRLVKYIDDLIDHEFDAYKSKQDFLQKELLTKYLHMVLPEINEFYEKNNYEKFRNLTIFQRKNLIKYFLEGIYNKYLIQPFKDKEITKNDYLFLKNKIRIFILYRYEKIIEQEK